MLQAMQNLILILFMLYVANFDLGSAFFGFSSNSNNNNGIQKTTQTGCLGWRQTKNCDPNGERDPPQDTTCNDRVANGRSGYCECAFGIVGRSGCRHNTLTCDTMCHRAFSQLSSDGIPNSQEDKALFDEIKDSVYFWNNWREVKFQDDGIFWAPTQECESEQCLWKVRGGKIYIMWGSDGLHTVVGATSGNKKNLEGNRYDGQRLTATFIRKEGYDAAGNALTGSDDDEDLYDILGVDVDATGADIRKAYRQLSKELHPDKAAAGNGNEGIDAAAMEQRFIKVQQAYEVLKDDDTRMVYDTGGMEAIEKIKDPNAGQQRGMDPFSMFFGGGFGGGMQNSNRGQDARLQMEVDLALLYTGGETVHKFNRRVVCRRCSKITDKNRERCNQCKTRCPGEIKLVQRRMGNMIVQQQEEAASKERCSMQDAELHVLIEQGMRDGQEIKFERKNEQTPGQIPGDVIIQIKQRRHRVFERVGENDLKTAAVVSLKEALTGINRHLTHVDGHVVLIRTEPNEVIYPRMIMRIPGEGMPVHDFPSQKGDLLVEFEVEFPKNLTPEQFEAISKYF